ncbi:MAG: type II secretion system protein N [Candidatus Methylomirabilia bacterium]
MSKRLLALNVLLAAASVALAVHLVRVLSAPRPLPAPTVSAVAPSGPSIKDGPAPSRPGLGAYEVVVRQNLFDPSRSDELVAPVASAAPKARLFLYGVVINGTVRLAYLQDPVTKRILGYRIGDTVAGGKLAEIRDDRVIIKRPEGPLEIKLKDPSKPKPVIRAKKSKRLKTGAPRAVRRPRVPPTPSVTPSAPGAAPREQAGTLRRPGPRRLPQREAGTPAAPPPSGR